MLLRDCSIVGWYIALSQWAYYILVVRLARYLDANRKRQCNIAPCTVLKGARGA